MIRVLAIYPAFDTRLNEMAMVWQNLCATRPLHCTVVAGAVDGLKGHSVSARHEQEHNLEIHRFTGSPRVSEDLLSVVRSARPSVIFCAVSHNMALAVRLQRATGAAIMLHNEYFFDDLTLLPRRYYGGIPFLRTWVCRTYRRWLLRHCARILCSNPLEFKRPRGQLPALVSYLPWPHPTEAAPDDLRHRERSHTAYIGSLSRAKGARTLCSYLARLFDDWPDARVSIVGPAVDKCGAEALRRVRSAGGERVDVRPHCSRAEALALLRRSLFVLSPGVRYGWGLIGDAWSSGTPVVAPVQHYDLEAGENCLIAGTAADFSAAVARLQSDRELWRRLSAAGLQTVAAGHSIDLTAGILYEKLLEVTRE